MSIKIESQEELELLQDVENGKYKSVDAKEFAEIEDSLKMAATKYKALILGIYRKSCFS